MKEDHLESACMDWLAQLGWTCLHGDEVSPGGMQCDRARYADVVLASRLREAAVRLNPGLTAAEIDEAVDKLSGYGAQSLVDGNKEVYDWLRNGVPVQRIEADGTRAVLRVRVIDFDGDNDLLAVRQFTVHGLAMVSGANGTYLSTKPSSSVIPAKAGIQGSWAFLARVKALDPRFRGDDGAKVSPFVSGAIRL